MNTPRLRRGGGIASSSNSFILPVLVFLFSIFCCDSASEFGAMGSTSFMWISCPNLLLVFSELIIFRNLYHISLAGVETFSGSFLFFCTLFWVSL